MDCKWYISGMWMWVEASENWHRLQRVERSGLFVVDWVFYPPDENYRV